MHPIHHSGVRLVPLAVLILLAALGMGLSSPTHADPTSDPARILPNCELALPGARIGRSSPAAGDLDGDGRNEFVVAGSDGIVYAVEFDQSCGGTNGSRILWQRQVANDINAVPGVNPSAQNIQSSPTIADLDRDGDLEIIVATGWMPEYHLNGAIIVLDHNGNKVPGWPRIARDLHGSGTPAWNPDGYADGFYSTPAVGEFDGDPDLELVVGGFDKCVYVLNHDNTPAAGWWDPAQNQPRHCLIDTIWSSPAVADLDNDGRMEIVIGTDAHPQYNGGSLEAYDHDGSTMWVRYTTQIIQSSPVIEDLDGNGTKEIVVGTGTYYPGNGGHKIYAFDRFGNNLPGWPVPTQGNMPSSPAVADLDGNGDMEIVIGCGTEPDVGNPNACNGQQLYVLHHTGQPVAGYPRPLPVGIPWTPRHNSAVALPIVIADLDGNGQDEILATGVGGWGPTVFQWNNPNNYKAYTPTGTAGDSLHGTPLLTNINQGGNLVMVTAGSFNNRGKVWLWRFGNLNASDLAWPMFRHDSSRTGNTQGLAPTLEVSHDEILLLHPVGNTQRIDIPIELANVGAGSFTWSVRKIGGAGGVSFAPTSGTVTAEGTLTVRVTTNRPAGYYDLGEIEITATSGGSPVAGSPFRIPLALHISQIHETYIPGLVR